MMISISSAVAHQGCHFLSGLQLTVFVGSLAALSLAIAAHICGYSLGGWQKA